MASGEILFSDDQLLELAETYTTPFHLVHEGGIRRTAQELNGVFDWVEPIDGVGYVNHFAVKAMSNIHVLDILREEGMGADASSGPEIELAVAAQMEEPFIMYTANNPPLEGYVEAYEAGAVINMDDISQIDMLQAALGGEFPETICFRYAIPEKEKSGGANDIIGKTEDSKFGVPFWDLEEAYRRSKDLGVKHFGLHTMAVSNELDYRQHVATAEVLFQKVAELSQKLGITFDFVNLGGGLGIPYHPEQRSIDRLLLQRGIQEAYEEYITGNDLPPLRVVTENGRYVTGPNVVTVFHARSMKDTYRRIVGLDGTTTVDVPRLAIYPDAHHEITVPGKKFGRMAVQSLAGDLCENNDWFAKDRKLPIIEIGDVVVVHDTGAHVYGMTMQYNGKKRAAEYLFQLDGGVRQIRRAETRDDLFATVDHPRLRKA